jgi:hypothetical protein
VTGCNPIVCTTPSILLRGYDFTNVAETNLDLSVGSFDVTGVVCADGYEGTATPVVCSTDGGRYTMTGCDPIICVRPDTSGYDFTNASETNLDLSAGFFDVTGVVCADGYEGTATPIVCSSDGPYNMTGCDPVDTLEVLDRTSAGTLAVVAQVTTAAAAVFSFGVL